MEEALDRLLEAIYDEYGYDFRQYSRAHVMRRIRQRMRMSRLECVERLIDQVTEDADFALRLVRDLSINVTEMFRDPDFYKVVRDEVIPVLKTWSFLRVWHAGCSTGEEVYSMAIVLKEEGLYDRVQIYATDFNSLALKQAEEGIFPADLIRKYAKNYQKSGARSAFSDYYHAQYDSAIMDSSLKKNIVWATHNLVTDSDFAEVQMIVCRNVMIYFNQELQSRVHGLFYNALVNGGVLCLGKKETMKFTGYDGCYSELDRRQKIYRKMYGSEPARWAV